MTKLLNQVQRDMQAVMTDWLETDFVQAGHLFVLGGSTSEVVGEHIGTAGSELQWVGSIKA